MLPATENVRKWTPSLGHVYTQPTPSALSKAKEDANTPVPDSTATDGTSSTASKTSKANKKDATEEALQRLAEESFATHMRHGGDYFDENPITGRPGDFHFASTGRKDNSKIAPPPPPPAQKPQKPGINTKVAEDVKKEGKAEKSPRTPNMPKPKRKKSKIATPAATPGPSQ